MACQSQPCSCRVFLLLEDFGKGSLVSGGPFLFRRAAGQNSPREQHLIREADSWGSISGPRNRLREGMSNLTADTQDALSTPAARRDIELMLPADWKREHSIRGRGDAAMR